MHLALTSLIALLSGAEPAPDGGLLPAPTVALNVTDPLLEPVPRPARSIQSFEEALRLLHEHSTDERTAEANVARAEGRWRQALATMLPNSRATVSGLYDLLNPNSAPIFGPGVSGATSPDRAPTIPVVTANATLSQSIVDISAWRNLSSASAAERSADENLSDVRRRLTLGLARTLVAVVAAERIAELNRLALMQALERAALTEKTERLGAANKLDVVRVQQDVEVARGTLISGDEQLRRARETLALLLGQQGELGVSPSLKLDSVIQEAQARCKPTEPENRADLLAARANVESAQKSREQATAGYLPALGLNSSLLGYTTQAGFGRFATWSVSAVITVPIWEGGARGGIIQERAALEEQAAQALEQQRRQVNVDVARARRGVEVADALRKAAAAAREKAADLDAMTRRAFEVGRGSSLELVQTAAALRQADVALATREFELVQARLDAYLTEARCDG